MSRATLAIIASIGISGSLMANEIPLRPAKGKSYWSMAGGPYCGILSLHAAMQAEGLPVRIEDLIQHKYVGSPAGSTIAELEAAVRDHGGHGRALSGLSAASLRSSAHPIILHTRRPGHATEFVHWVLFLGCEGDMARILDSPHAIERIPMTELLALWDGTGLIVSHDPVYSWTYSWAGWAEAGIVFVVLLGGLSCVKRWQPPRHGLVGFAGRTVIVAFVACGFGVTWNLIHPDGMLTDRTAVGHVAVKYFAPAVPEATTDEVQASLEKPNATIVDARSPDSYERGHIHGAVNVPIFASLTRRREVFDRIPRNRRVIVYCQSESCEWAESIASDLVLKGFRDVAVYRGGWAEWVHDVHDK